MPRPKKVIRSVQKSTMLPEDVLAKVELRLYSPLEGRVPQGAWQGLVVGLLREWLEREEGKMNVVSGDSKQGAGGSGKCAEG